MSDPPFACWSCGVEVAATARFCGACGARSALARTSDPPRPTPRELRQRALGVTPHGAALWRRFAPALQLWIWLLATNGLLGLAGHMCDISSPWWDVGATAVDFALLSFYVLPDRRSLWPALRSPGLSRATFWHPLAAMAAFVAIDLTYFRLFESLGGEFFTYLDDFRAAGWPLWSALVLISLCPAVLEEIACRGFILGRLDEVMGRRDALVVQAAMFSVLHMLPAMFLSHFLFGLILGLLRRSTRSLVPGIVVHAAWNAWVVIDELSTQPA